MIIKKIDNGLVSAGIKSGVFPLQLIVYLYIVDGVLIDAGSANIQKMTKILLKNEKVNCVAITHVHEDHTGAAAWIKENMKIPVYINKNSIAEAMKKSDIPLYRRLVWGNRDGFVADPVPLYIETGKYRLDVINAPGHQKDHVVYHEKNMGWLFTGDLYVSRRQVVAFKDENIGDAINSIKKILELDFDKILCGHSGVHFNGKEKFKSKLDFFLEIQEKVKTLEKEGISREEINRCLFPKKNLWEFLSHGEWSSMNIVKSI